MNELWKANCEDASSLHISFCSPFSLNELSTAISNLSSSTASGPDQIAYPLLKHLPEPAKLLFLSIFNRSWHSHTSPFCWKPSTIIPIHKPGKPTSSPSSFRPISLTSCISKLFERLILSRLTFHLESNHLLSTCQAGFRPGRSSLDQILTLSQSIWDGFQKKKPSDRTILASVDFSKAFDSVWHSALFHKLLSLKLPSCFVLWVRSFLSDRRAKVQVGGSHSRSFRIRRGVPQGSVLGPVLFILFVDDITKDLPRDAHSSLYADDLAIWSSSPDPLKASSVVQSSLAVLETWSNLWRLPLNPKKCESSFFSIDPHQATFQPRLNLLGFPLSFNPTPKFLGVTFDRLYPLGPMSNPCVPNSIHATQPFTQLPLRLGVPQKNLSPYSTKPLSVRCSHMPLLDGSHSSATLQPITWKFYTELHAGSLLDASLPPPPHYSFSRPNSLL